MCKSLGLREADQRAGRVEEIDSVWRGWPMMGRRGLKSRGRKAGERKWEDDDG
jgi:hypothetical protein